MSGFDTERTVHVMGTGVILLITSLLIRGMWNARRTKISRYEIEINKQAGELGKISVLVASDLHLGDIVGKRHLRKFIRHAEKMKPDLILLPGDVIDDEVKPFIERKMDKLMARLQGKYGTFAILGNHEYYGKQIDSYVHAMENIGIKVLQDETVTIADAIVIAGRKDKTAETMQNGRMTVNELLAEEDLSAPVFVMDHQPKSFGEASAAGADLLLCGHTHRGQFYPNHWITRKIFELDWGYLLKNRTHIIVSCGFGTWGPPVRLGSRAEIIEIEVHFRPH